MRPITLTIWVTVVVLLTAGTAPADLTNGLVAYYPFNGNANDESGYGHHGTVEGAVLTTDCFGNPNSAYSFDGLNDRIVIGDYELVTGNQLSVQAWFKTTNALGGSGDYISPLVSKLWSGISYYIGGTLDSSDKIEFVLSGGFRALSNMELNDGLWHHAVGVYDGTLPQDNVKLYIDGILQSTTAGNAGDIADTGNRLAIGANVRPDGRSFYPYDYFGGAIDDVRIYNRALSESEVRQLYGKPATLLVQTEPNDINTVTPSVGPHDYPGGWVSIKAERFVNCPDVYTFDHWDGDVNDPNSADTTVFMDSDKTITAIFVSTRQCGDECHPYPIGDLDKDCEVTFGDFALFASHWLDCTKPECD